MPRRIFLKFCSSISFKIALIVMLPIMAISIFFSYQQHMLDQNWILRIAESRLLRIGEGLKSSIETFTKKDVSAGVQNSVDQTAKGADIALIVVINQRGKVIACNDTTWIGKPFFDMHSEWISDADKRAFQKSITERYSVYYEPRNRQYRIVMPVSYGSEGPGALFISLDPGSMEAISRWWMIGDVFISIMTAALTGIFIYFILYYVFTVRLKSVATAAAKFASGDMSSRADATGTDEIGYLATSFNLLAGEITNWRNNLEKIAAGRLNELQVLFDIVNTISQSLELNTVLPSVLDRVIDNLGAVKGAIVLVTSDGRSLILPAQRGLSEEGVGRIIQFGQGCVGDVILKNRAMRISAGDEDGPAAVLGLEQDNLQSALVVPISSRGVILGALAVYSEKQDRFTDEDEALLATIGNQVSVAVLNARLYEKTLELAQLDGLTGLANRRYLMERLQQEMERAERYQTSLSVLMLDVDKFKSFNDTYGHLKGDELLKSFAAMIKDIVRTADIAGRYGGEEFCVILPNTSNKGAVLIAERIRKTMEELKITIGSDQPPVGRTASIGVAEFTAGDSVEKLLSIADAALYRAKEGGRNRVES